MSNAHSCPIKETLEAPQEYAKCCVEGCHADTNQRYDKFGGIAEHQKTKLLFCVGHAVEGIRNKTITDWDFKEFGVDEEHPPEGYDSLAINPKCDKCEMRLSEDDMTEWLKNPAMPPSCEDCLNEGQNCHGCGVFLKDGEEEVFPESSKAFCSGCFERAAEDKEDEEKAEDEMAHLEAQVEAQIEQVAESRGGRK